MRAFLLGALALATALTYCAAASTAQAGEQPYGALVIGSHTDPPDANTWTYTIQNTSANAGFALWIFAISVNPEASVLDVVTPPGWEGNWDDPHFITWTCDGEMTTGESQCGFAATFDTEPTVQEWTAMFDNLSNPGETPADFGLVLFVPEPAGIITLLAGLSTLAATIRRRAH